MVCTYLVKSCQLSLSLKHTNTDISNLSNELNSIRTDINPSLSHFKFNLNLNFNRKLKITSNIKSPLFFSFLSFFSLFRCLFLSLLSPTKNLPQQNNFLFTFAFFVSSRPLCAGDEKYYTYRWPMGYFHSFFSREYK